MQTYAWWIDEPLVMASSNPSDEDLARLRVQGFSVVVSLLEERKQPPRYNKQAAAAAGWAIYTIPIEEGGVPSREQLAGFLGQLRAFPEGTKLLLHCESGLGRSAFMGAVYWIAKGLSAIEAMARVQQAGLAADWITPQREDLLHECAQLQRAAGTK
jgi:protein-tyrosine phosphatase